ncbi:MAG: DUF1003 domain-containing protein [Chlamydiales bacterium]
MSMIRRSVIDASKKIHPSLTYHEGFVCFDCLRDLHALRHEELLREENGALSQLEQEVIDSIREQDFISENIHEEFEEHLTFGEKCADKIARFGGSWTFISLFGTILIAWMTINSIQLYRHPFDPYPYILLNLLLSSLAAFQAPIIMMSQNRQAAKDRLSFENDYLVNLKAELQIRQLNTRLDLFMKHHWQKMHEIARGLEELMIEIDSKHSPLSSKKKELLDPLDRNDDFH